MMGKIVISIIDVTELGRIIKKIIRLKKKRYKYEESGSNKDLKKKSRV